jgi:ABC-type multidrug transport system fused ATPase/permease subunit
MARYMAATHVLTTAATVLVLGLGGWRVVQGRLTPGGVAAFLGYVVMFFRPIEMVSELYNMLLHALAGAERILEVLNTEPTIVDRPAARDPEHLEGAVTFDHVSFEYMPDVPVLHDICLEVQPGEMVALVGPTGAGKTSVCRLIARFYEVEKGAVRIDGVDVREFTQLGLHRHMGIVLQENFLFSGSVMDNIRYGRPDATDEQVVACAREVGSHGAIEALPAGYATMVGERGESLSAGQRQLICYTRALMAAPRILILDEATSAVDTATEMELQAALRRLTEQRTCFIVAHRLSTVREADRVVVIEDGRITEQGTHAELVAAAGRYAAMYEDFIRSE